MKNVALLFILLAMIYAEFSLGKDGSFKTDSCLNYVNHVLGHYKVGNIEPNSSVINFPKPGSKDYNKTLKYESKRSKREDSMNDFHLTANTKETHQFQNGEKLQKLAVMAYINKEQDKVDYDYSIMVTNENRIFPSEWQIGSGKVLNKHYQFKRIKDAKGVNNICVLDKILIGSDNPDEKSVFLDFKLCSSILKGLKKSKEQVKPFEKRWNESFKDECEKLTSIPSSDSNSHPSQNSGLSGR